MLQIPGFAIDKQLWCEGMARAYEARERSTNRRVVLEVLLGTHQPGGDLDTYERTRLTLEAVACLRHEYIWTVEKVGQHERMFYLVRPYEPVRLLRDILQQTTPSPHQVARWVRDLAKAVQCAHDHGLCYLDVNLDTVAVREDGRPWIRGIDVAYCSFLPLILRQEHHHTIYGRPVYMAPELFRLGRGEFRPAADIWGLGVLLYRLLTGRLPFEGANVVEIILQTMETNAVPPKQLNPSVAADLDWICTRCLQRDARWRPADATTLAALIDSHLAGRPVVPQQEPTLASRLLRQFKGLLGRS